MCFNWFCRGLEVKAKIIIGGINEEIQLSKAYIFQCASCHPVCFQCNRAHSLGV